MKHYLIIELLENSTKKGRDFSRPFFYDVKGNVIKAVKYNSLDASSKLYTQTEYDESGKTISTVKTTYNGSADYETVTDYLGNVIKTVYNGEVQTQNEYTPSGNLVSAVDNVVGKTETYTYDSFDRKTGYSAVKPSKTKRY